jgi:hypothetical protein
MLPGQIAKIQRAFWTPQPGPLEVIQAVIWYVTNLPLPGLWLAAGLTVGLIALVFSLVESLRAAKQKKLAGLLFALAFLPPILLFIVSYLMRPVFVPRAFLASAAGFLGLAGSLIALRWPRPPAWILLGMFVVGSAVGLPEHYTFAEFPRSPYASAMNSLRAEIRPGDQIIHDNKLSFFPAHYYAPDLKQNFLADAPGTANDTLALASQQAFQLFPEEDVLAAAGNAGRVFFVVFQTTLQEYQAAGLAEHPQIKLLKASYRLAGETHFNDLVVYQFER